MKLNTLKYIFDQFEYSYDKWISVPEISRIGLGDSAKLYTRDSGVMKSQLYLDTIHSLLLQRMVQYNGDNLIVLGIANIIDIAAISSVETLNAYSESIFVGHPAL